MNGTGLCGLSPLARPGWPGAPGRRIARRL